MQPPPALSHAAAALAGTAAALAGTAAALAVGRPRSVGVGHGR
jgi:hypothetical protein